MVVVEIVHQQLYIIIAQTSITIMFFFFFFSGGGGGSFNVSTFQQQCHKRTASRFPTQHLYETIESNMGPKKGKGKKGKVEEEKAEPTGTTKRCFFF